MEKTYDITGIVFYSDSSVNKEDIFKLLEKNTGYMYDFRRVEHDDYAAMFCFDSDIYMDLEAYNLLEKFDAFAKHQMQADINSSGNETVFSIDIKSGNDKDTIKGEASVWIGPEVSSEESSILIDRKVIDKMYNEYIGKCAILEQELQGSYNEGFISGQKTEAEHWLKQFGVDLSYEKVHKDICKESCKGHLNETLFEIVKKNSDPIYREAALNELKCRGVDIDAFGLIGFTMPKIPPVF